MSGICGIVRLNGEAAEARSIEGMLGTLARRGPDGNGKWSEGRAALGHTLLATTPEALSEHMPFRHAPSDCVITADVRLDNRSDLIERLGLQSHRPGMGDGELVLHAYLKWGTDCPAQLLGDFAFAVWDGRRQTLFCARDRIGMRKLAYWHVPGRSFVFATEPNTILSFGEVERVVNLVRVADYIDRLESADLTSTFYQGIYRLPPAHTLTVRGDGVHLQRYWEPKRSNELVLRSDGEYVEAFLDVFTQAVRCRLRSAKPPAAMLSGGLDSGSIAAIASRLTLSSGLPSIKTFSAVGPDPSSCPETQAIVESSKMKGINPELICYAAMDDCRDNLLKLTRESQEPFDGHMILARAVYLAAARSGVNVVLDGVAGDVMFTPDYPIAWLIRGGELSAAWRESVGESEYWGGRRSAMARFRAAAAQNLVPRPIRQMRRDLLRRRRSIAAGSGLRPSSWLMQRVNLAQRRQQYYEACELSVFPDKSERERIVVDQSLVAGRERYDRVASELGIEPRDPFMDPRVLEFCLSLPRAQLQFQGWPKILLRRAMQDMLPDTVRWKKGRHHVGWGFTTELLANLVAKATFSLAPEEHFSQFADLAGLHESAFVGMHYGREDSFDASFLLNWFAVNG